MKNLVKNTQLGILMNVVMMLITFCAKSSMALPGHLRNKNYAEAKKCIQVTLAIVGMFGMFISFFVFSSLSTTLLFALAFAIGMMGILVMNKENAVLQIS